MVKEWQKTRKKMEKKNILKKEEFNASVIDSSFVVLFLNVTLSSSVMTTRAPIAQLGTIGASEKLMLGRFTRRYENEWVAK